MALAALKTPADLQKIIEAQQGVKDETEKERLDSIKTLLE